MIPPSFTYARATSVDEALGLAAEHGEDAKYLAGGQSLLPLMKLRFAAPTVLIDLGRVTELSYVRDEGTYVAVGALTRHHDVANSELLLTDIPLLAHTAEAVGDPQIRHRGTIGGSVAHADAAADLPATLLALDATFVVRGSVGARSVPAAEFFKGIFETALEPGELLTEIQVPKPAAPAAWSFQKFNKRAIDFAMVGVAVQGTGYHGGGTDQHGLDAAAGHRRGVRAGQRCLDRRRGGPGRGGHERGLRHPRVQGLPRAPGPRPGPACPRGGFHQGVSP